MNTLGYIKNVILDEFQAIKEEVRDSKILALAFVAVIVLIVIYLKPFPARHIYFATYYPNSDWAQLAEKTASLLKNHGIDISVLYTNGALDNVARLSNRKDEANAGYTYGFALNQEDLSNIYSLGSVAYEPVWILYNKSRIGEVKSLSALAQYRVGLGPLKSGSYQIAKKIFEVMNIELDNNAHFKPDNILKNAEKLKSGEIDAFIFASTYWDPTTQELLRSPNIAVYDFKNAQAYTKKFNAFVALTLSADSIDILKQIPKQDISLLATTTSLVVNRNMHPDLQLALLMAARDANRNAPNLFFAKRNEFPAYLDPSIPIGPVAEHFYDYGPPHAMRYLPYWLAGLVDRAWLLLLTLFAILYPLAKLNIHFRKFRFNLKEIPHYKELLEIEKRLCDHNLSAQDKAQLSKRLDWINVHAIKAGVPINEEAAYFEFLNAIYLLRKKIEEA
jgi:TRAP-type uncharacterized transport system substrate-binding protein